MDLYEDKNFKPMLLTEIEKPFNDPDYIFEAKFDGTRALVFVEPNEIIIQNRNENIITDTFPELENIRSIVKKKCIFDGEIVLMVDGKPSFKKLQERLLLKNEFRIDYFKENFPVTFVCFDIIYENGDLTNLTLMDRKKILEKYKDTDFFVKTRFVEKSGTDLYEVSKKQGLEGIVAKHKDSKYHINKRTKQWIKIKHWMEDEFYIGAYNEEDNEGSLASLSIGIKENDGKLKYIGNVSIGKRNPAFLKIKKEKTDTNPFIEYKEKNYTFVKPIYECTISFLEKTKSGSLRQPIFKGLRLDKISDK